MKRKVINIKLEICDYDENNVETVKIEQAVINAFNSITRVAEECSIDVDVDIDEYDYDDYDDDEE